MHKHGIIGLMLLIIIFQLSYYTSGFNPDSVKIHYTKKKVIPDINKEITSEEYKEAKKIKDIFFTGCTPCKNNRLVQKDYKVIVHLVGD